MAHRRLRGRPLLHLPYMEALIRDPLREVVILKSAQAGISELLLSYAAWAADTQLGGRGHVLYVMPTQNMIDDFTQGRLDRALADSPYLAGRMRPAKGSGKGPDNKRIKRIGDGLIYLRGCENSKQIASPETVHAADWRTGGGAELLGKQRDLLADRVLFGTTDRSPPREQCVLLIRRSPTPDRG